jgi:signal transduction histidine kinase
MPSGQTILVVDDDATCRRVVAKILGPEGYPIVEAAGGSEALAIAATAPPDLVILDWNMPDMSGLEVLRRLRDDARTSQVATLFVTAKDDPASRVEALAAGADDFLSKPFEPKELRIRANLLLRRQANLRELGGRLAQLERLDQWKDDLVHMIIHDMGNALAGTMGYLDLALAGPVVPPDVARDIQSAIGCAKSVQRMIADLLDLRRLEEGKLPLELQRFEVASLFRETIATMQAVAATRRKEIVTDIDPDVPPVIADRGLLGRVIGNLIMNAVKYSGKGARIILGARPAGEGKVQLSVDDEGPGIAAEVRRRLFEKFVTSGLYQKEGERGRGLGLAFCKVVVEAHGGAISVAAREPVGTRFQVELPVGTRPATVAAAPGGAAAAHG